MPRIIPPDSEIVTILPEERPTGLRGLTFPEAIAMVTTGKKIRRFSWEDNAYYVLLWNDRLSLHKPSGTIHDWIISTEDLNAEDWGFLL